MSVLATVKNTFLRLFTTQYAPNPQLRTFLSRAQSQEDPRAKATVAVLDATESEQAFGVPLARRGIQPVYLKIENRSDKLLRLQLVRIDPKYYTALEAAGVNHFSIVKRLSAFGFIAWFFWLILPMLILVPFKLITAWRANRRMDDCFRANAFRLRPIPPGGTAEGFVFTPLDSGTKVVHVSLHATGDLMDSATGKLEAGEASPPIVEFTFSISVPGIAVDYLRRDFDTLEPVASLVECDLPTLVSTTGRDARRPRPTPRIRSRATR